MSKVKVLLIDEDKKQTGDGGAAAEGTDPETRVLLVDDEQEYIETLAERLRSRGLQVDTATSGAEALDLVATRGYKAVVLDFAMPGMDGIETLRALRERHPDLQAVLLTGHATIKVAMDAARLKAVDILEKPTDINTLLEKLGPQ